MIPRRGDQGSITAQEIIEAYCKAFNVPWWKLYLPSIWGGVDFKIADATYFPADMAAILEVIQEDRTENQQYSAEDYDCDDYTYALMGAFHVHTTTGGGGLVTCNGAIHQLGKALDVDAPAAPARGFVAADGAIGQFQNTLAGHEDASPVPSRAIATHRAVDQHQRTLLPLDPASGAAPRVELTRAISDVVADCTVDQRHAAEVVQTATGTGVVLRDHAML